MWRKMDINGGRKGQRTPKAASYRGAKLACKAVISSVPYSSASLVACQTRDSRDLEEPDASLQGCKESEGRGG